MRTLNNLSLGNIEGFSRKQENKDVICESGRNFEIKEEIPSTKKPAILLAGFTSI